VITSQYPHGKVLRHPGAVGIDSRSVALAVLTVAAAVGLGFAAGAWAGVVTAFAGLVPTALWETTRERRERNKTAARRREKALAIFAPPIEVADAGVEVAGDDPAERGAAWYLRPEAQVVSFRPRPELGELLEWCVTVGHLGVRLVTGDGGAGKTRLAVQLSQDLARDGWRVMWVPPGWEGAAIGAVRAVREPALLVVDYAETRPGLAGLLADAAGAADCPELRVVLLARSAGEWWQELLDGVEYRLGQVLEAAAPISLGPVTGASGQQEIFDEAMEAFAGRLEVACSDATLTLTDPDAVVLVVHAAALLAVLDHAGRGGGSRPSQTARDVLTGLLRHEARYWHKSAAARGLRLDPSVERLAVAVACLIGADSEAEATGRLSGVPDLAGSPERRGQVARWLRDLYPGSPDPPGAGERDWIGSLRPNRLAEQLVTEQFWARPALLPHLFAGLSKHRIIRALTVLARAALTDARAVDVLRRAFETDLKHLAVPALTVAVETNPVIAGLINDALAAQPVSRQTLEDIAAAIPRSTSVLAETAADVFQRLVDQSGSDSKQRAAWLRALSVRLSDLGRSDDALAAGQEAARIERPQVAKAPVQPPGGPRPGPGGPRPGPGGRRPRPGGPRPGPGGPRPGPGGPRPGPGGGPF
jgi:hypothetical protein